jgi:HAD superfamily hydrolase (TIGR01509 family)
MVEAVILDVDGTLVDSNYHHVLAWSRAFHAHGCTAPLWQIHRAMGMGADKLIKHLLGSESERAHGDEIRASESQLYSQLIGEVEPLPEARKLLVDLKDANLQVILASSAKQSELDHYLDLLEARELVDGWTSSADVEATKPDPDIVQVALQKAGSTAAVMVGDATWDVISATAAGLPTICITTGGFSKQELEAVGAIAVVESLGELRQRVRDGSYELSGSRQTR